MDKQLFIRSINAIQEQFRHNAQVAEAAAVIYSNAFEANLINSRDLHNVVIELLQVATGDDKYRDCIGGSWIDYFIFELDFGNKFKPGMVTLHGKDYDMSDAGKLYDFIIKSKTGDENND